MHLRMIKLTIMLVTISFVFPILKYRPDLLRKPTSIESEMVAHVDEKSVAESLTMIEISDDSDPHNPISEERTTQMEKPKNLFSKRRTDSAIETEHVISETEMTPADELETAPVEEEISLVEEKQADVPEMPFEQEIKTAVTETTLSAADVPDEPVSTETPTVHSHTWIPVTEIIHHDAEYQTVHHEALIEQVWVIDRLAYDESYENTYLVGVHDFCKGCDLDITAAGLTYEEYEAHDMQHILNGEDSGYYSKGVYDTRVETVHHEAEGHFEERVVQEAYDEKILTSEAWDEEVVIGQRCMECSAVK